MNRKVQLGISFALSTILFAALVAFAGPQKLVAAILNADPVWVAAGGLLFTVLWVPKTWKWLALLRLDGTPLPYGRAFAAIVATNASNILVPGRLGDVVRGLTVRGSNGATFWRGMSGTLLDRLLDFFATVIVALLAILFVPGGLPDWMRLAVAVGLSVGLAAALLVFGSRRLITRVERWFLAKWHASGRALQEAMKPVDTLRRRWRATIGLVLLAVAIWVAESFSAVFVAKAVGALAPMGAVVLALQLANLAKAIPITPGGLGTYEAAFAAVLIVYGVPPDIAASVAVLDHALKNLLTLILGFAFSGYLGISVSHPPKSETVAAEPIAAGNGPAPPLAQEEA